MTGAETYSGGDPWPSRLKVLLSPPRLVLTAARALPSPVRRDFGARSRPLPRVSERVVPAMSTRSTAVAATAAATAAVAAAAVADSMMAALGVQNETASE